MSNLLVQNIKHTNGTTAATVSSGGAFSSPGHVVQTVYHSFSDETVITSTSFTDCTGSSFTFTPKFASSKLIINFNAHLYIFRDSAGQGGTAEVNVDGTRIGADGTAYENYYALTGVTTVNNLIVASKEVQMDASNTNAKTIKMQARAYSTANNGKIELNENANHTSTIKVLEIAQ